MKRFTLLIAFVLSLLLSFGCCATLTNINSQRADLVSHLKNSTATLVMEYENGAYVPFCGAVWINKTDMVTARHCVEDDDEKVEIGSTLKFQIYKEFEGTYPFSKNDKVYIAKVIAAGADNEDLAFLRALDDVEHGIATIATYNPVSGQVLHHVGHPNGLQWSYLKLTVSSERTLDIEDGPKRHVLNVIGFAWRGSSGGGSFDNEGNLAGIASMLLRAPGQTLFVHPKVIKKLLDKNKIKYYTN